MSRNAPDFIGIERHIQTAAKGDIGLVGFANAINATIRDVYGLSEAEVRELCRLRQLAIDKACE